MISTSNKSKPTTTTSTTIETHECCMCGDYGFSYELFQCKLCQFRSQHRYCSNLYPNVPESHKICNWCLSQKDQEAKEKSQNSSNSSSSFRNEDDSITKININNHKKNIINSNTKQQKQQGSNHINNNTSLIVRRQGRVNQLQLSKYGPIKKQRSVEVLLPSPAPATSPAVTTRKKIVTNGAKEDAAERLIRRTRSEDISKTHHHHHHHHGITKQVFRNKVRRYKLLDEVSS